MSEVASLYAIIILLRDREAYFEHIYDLIGGQNTCIREVSAHIKDFESILSSIMITDYLAATTQQIEVDLGLRLRRRRVELGLNQTEVAERAGLARRTVSSVERGEGASMTTFIALLRALGALDQFAADFAGSRSEPDRSDRRQGGPREGTQVSLQAAKEKVP